MDVESVVRGHALTVFIVTQVYESVMTEYVPKRLRSQPDGMGGCLQLATSNKNYNVNRGQDATANGEGHFKMQCPHFKGDYTAKKIFCSKEL